MTNTPEQVRKTLEALIVQRNCDGIICQSGCPFYINESSGCNCLRRIGSDLINASIEDIHYEEVLIIYKEAYGETELYKLLVQAK